MELSAQLPADLLTLAAPARQAPPEVLHPPDGVGQAAAAAAPFDTLLLELAGTAMPTGGALPVSGKGLPFTPTDPPGQGAPDAAPLDALVASELLALVVPPQPQLPVEPAPSPAGSPAPALSASASAPPTPVELATLPRSGAALDRAVAPLAAIPLPDAVDAGTASSDAPGDMFSDAGAPDAVLPEGILGVPSAGGAAATARAPAGAAPAASAADLAAAMVVLEPAPAAAPSAALSAREVRPSTERRVVITPADPQRASVAPLAQLFDVASTPSSGGGAAAAPQPAGAADSLPLAVTPSAATAVSADAQPIAPAHSPSVSLPHPATAFDGSSPTATSSAPSQGASVDTTAARWHDALASRVQWLVDHDVGEARIRLNPPELGALDVKISLHDDKTFVQLTAHNAAARDELSQSLPRLRELLSANGLELGGATVSGGHDGGAGRYPGADSAARSIDFAAPADPQPVRALSATAGGGASSRIDVFA